MDPRTGAVVPSNLVPGRPLRLAKDNLDCDKESQIAGHSAGFHGTNMAAFQNGPAIPIDVSKMKFSKHAPEIPEALHQIMPVPGPIKKDPPYALTEEEVNAILDVESGVGGVEYKTSVAKDLAFMLYRANTNHSTDKKADWTEFNKFLHKKDLKPASVVDQTPILNAKADAHDTIYTCGERGRYIAREVGADHVFFTVDQGLHGPAQEVKWTLGAQWDDVTYGLGGLHSDNAFMNTIGDHIAGSELPEMWVNSGIITEGAADKVLHGNDLKTGLKIHKISVQAAWRILLPQLMTFLEINNPDMHQDLHSLMYLRSETTPDHTSEDSIAPLITRLDKQDFRDILDEFIEIKKQDKSFTYFWTYMEMVNILLAFVRADRSDNWPLHVNSFTRMLGPFERYVIWYCLWFEFWLCWCSSSCSLLFCLFLFHV